MVEYFAEVFIGN